MSWVNEKTDTEKLVELCIEMCNVIGTCTSPSLTAPAAAIVSKLLLIKAEQASQRAMKIIKLADLEIAVKQINDLI